MQERAGHCSTPFELGSYLFGHIMRHDSRHRDLIEGMVESKRGRGRPECLKKLVSIMWRSIGSLILKPARQKVFVNSQIISFDFKQIIYEI